MTTHKELAKASREEDSLVVQDIEVLEELFREASTRLAEAKQMAQDTVRAARTVVRATESSLRQARAAERRLRDGAPLELREQLQAATEASIANRNSRTRAERSGNSDAIARLTQEYASLHGDEEQLRSQEAVP